MDILSLLGIRPQMGQSQSSGSQEIPAELQGAISGGILGAPSGAPNPNSPTAPSSLEGTSKSTDDAVQRMIDYLAAKKPEDYEQDFLRKRGLAKDNKWWQKLLGGVAEGVTAISTGMSHQPYTPVYMQAQKEGREEYVKYLEMLNKLAGTQSMTRHRQNQDTTAADKVQMQTGIAQQKVDETAKRNAAYVAKLNKQIALMPLQLDNATRNINSQIDYRKAAGGNLSALANLHDAQTERTQVQTQDMANRGGLTGDAANARLLDIMGPGKSDGTMSMYERLMRAQQMRQRPGIPTWTLNSQAVESWNPETRQLEPSYRGTGYNRRDPNSWFKFSESQSKPISTTERPLLVAGAQAENTTNALVSQLADAYVTGKLEPIKGLNGLSLMRGLRRLGIGGSDYSTEESLANVLTPTGQLQHLKQIYGSRAPEKFMENFSKMLGLESLSSPQAVLRSAIALSLVTQHNNDILGGASGAADFDTTAARKLRKQVDKYMKDLELLRKTGTGKASQLPTARQIIASEELPDEVSAPGPVKAGPGRIKIGK